MDVSTQLHHIIAETEDGKHSSALAAVAKLDSMNYEWHNIANIRILRNFTAEPVADYLKLFCYSNRIKVHIELSDFNTFEQEIRSPGSQLYQSKPDMIILALCLDTLPAVFDSTPGNLLVDSATSKIKELLAIIKNGSTALIVLNTFHRTFSSLFLPVGSDKHIFQVNHLNQNLREMVQNDSQLALVDIAELVARHGTPHSLDNRYWYMFKTPFTPKLFREWGKGLAQAVTALKRSARKVLVLDCDNTLWGGVVGEDGINDIKLHRDDYPGNAFHSFQQQVLQLHRQGVLIALCSKNNEEDVWEVLDSHPYCLIKRQHLVAWRINWTDKVTNIVALGKELNLGLDSFVFVDDNPAECELVKKSLPEVDVLQVPAASYELPSLLADYWGFFKFSVTDEDRNRTEQYQAQRARELAASRHDSLEDFLVSLSMKAEIGPMRADEAARVAQLTQKTNQFNLTTRRYSQPEIEALHESESGAVLIMKVDDVYGSYGLTAVAILTRDENACRIDSFMMSCRILGRKLETLFLGLLLTWVEENWGTTRVLAEYRKTPKNGQVENFFDTHGFNCVRDDSGCREYEAKLPLSGLDTPSFITTFRR